MNRGPQLTTSITAEEKLALLGADEAEVLVFELV